LNLVIDITSFQVHFIIDSQRVNRERGCEIEIERDYNVTLLPIYNLSTEIDRYIDRDHDSIGAHKGRNGEKENDVFELQDAS